MRDIYPRKERKVEWYGHVMRREEGVMMMDV